MFLFSISIAVLGLFAYQRGWAKRVSRRSIYEGLMAQLEGAREQFATEPTMTNRHNVDRCELNALYESQRGRPLCRLGILLIAMGAILALIYR